jgi:hypothetical protein
MGLTVLSRKAMSSNLASPARPLLSMLVRGLTSPEQTATHSQDRNSLVCNLLNFMKKTRNSASPFVLHAIHAYGRDSAGIPQEIR